jgi:5-methylthioadenosine/S-adenosylhomocysteine deaminase
MIELMIVAADWVFPVTSPPLFRHAVEIKNGQISEIRPIKTSDPYQPGTCVLPGLVNVHTHLAYTVFRNLLDELPFFPWIRKVTELKYKVMTEADFDVSTRLGILECARAGITTVADMSDHESALQALSQSPLRGIFYWEIFGVEEKQADLAWRNFQRLFPEIQKKYSTSKLRIGVSPHSCYTVRPELFKKIAEFAIKNDIPVSFHLSESKEEEEFIAHRSGPIQEFLKDRITDWKITGRSVVEHLEPTGIFEAKPLLAHLVQVSDEDLDALQNHPVSIAHCPKSNAKFAHGVAPLTKFLQRGFKTGLGTDSAASNHRLDLFEEGRFALLSQRAESGEQVPSEQEILELWTIRGAEALQMHDQIGSLEPGKAADLIVVQIPTYYTNAAQILNHLVNYSTGNDVLQTIIGGRVVSLEAIDAKVRDVYERLMRE